MTFNYWESMKNGGNAMKTLVPHIEKGRLSLRQDGKITLNTSGTLLPSTPWLFIKKDQEKECFTWHTIIFDMLGMMPAPCLNCWKVVVRPRTLREHMQLFEIMKELDRPSKLGIEVRNEVHGLYGAYFYNNSYEAGLDCYETIRDLVDRKISSDVPVVLKRGCTEFEAKFGPSDQWESKISDDDLQTQRWLFGVVELPPNDLEPETLKKYVMEKWVRWAYANGDETYKDFTDGKPLFSPYVTYHDMASHCHDGKDGDK